MTQIDNFASTLLEEAKQFLEKSSEDASDDAGRQAYLHAALMLAFSSLEAHLNAIADDFAAQNVLTPHELGTLLERAVRLENGEFKMQSALQIARLEDRIQLLHRRFGGEAIDKSSLWWTHLMSALMLRNELTHPKGVPSITPEAVARSIQAIIDTLDAVYKAVYKRKFPAVTRGLHSRLGF